MLRKVQKEVFTDYMLPRERSQKVVTVLGPRKILLVPYSYQLFRLSNHIFHVLFFFFMTRTALKIL